MFCWLPARRCCPGRAPVAAIDSGYEAPLRPPLGRLGALAATVFDARIAPSAATTRRVLNTACPGGPVDLLGSIGPGPRPSQRTARTPGLTPRRDPGRPSAGRGSGADLTFTPLRVPDKTNKPHASASWIVLDGLWEIAKPLIPAQGVWPQGGGTQGTPDETLSAAIAHLWSPTVSGAGCRSACTYQCRRLTAGSRHGPGPASGAARTTPCCTGSTTSASATSPASLRRPRVISPSDAFRPEAHSWRPWSSPHVRTTPRFPASAIHGPPASSASAGHPARISCPGLPKGFRSARSTPVTVSSTSGHTPLPGCGESA